MEKSIDELSKDISDPTDFPKDDVAPGLQVLDQACRCSICGDIFDAPMILQCGHSFCSLCVRQFLRERHECPSCRAPSEEIHLSKNVVVEEICMKWKITRPFILDLMGKVSSPSRPVKRRKLKSDVDTSHETTPKTLHGGRAPAIIATKRSHSSTEEQESDVVELMSDSEDETLRPELVPSSDVEENDTISDQNDLVNCPICSGRTRLRYINVHMDSGCKQHVVNEMSRSERKQRDSAKSQWNSMFSTSARVNGSKGKGKTKNVPDIVGESAERLPKPTYHSLKEKKIREMLAEFDLSTQGSRSQLVARHTQFVILYNANLDRPLASRRRISALQKELKAWEGGLLVKKISIDDSNAYLKAQNVEFKKRIEEARASRIRDKTRIDEVPSSLKQAQTLDTAQAQNESSFERPPVGLGDEANQNTPDVVISDSEDELIKL